MTTATAAKPSGWLARAKAPGAAPSRILLYGVEGVGKSTFGAAAPAPIFMAAEDGIRHLPNTVAFPEPEGLDDIYGMLDELAAGGHERKTLVVDTIDWLEPIIVKAVCDKNKWEDLETPGYGKGWTPFLNEWRKILSKFDRVRAVGVEVILLAHAKVSNFSNPKGADFSRYELAMNQKSAALVKQWCDFILFANFDDFVMVSKGRGPDILGKGKGVSKGSRVIHTTHDAAWDAKFRGSGPAVMPLDYDKFAEARAAGGGLAVDIRAELKSMLAIADLPPERVKKMNDFLGDWSDTAKVERAINILRTEAEEKEAAK